MTPTAIRGPINGSGKSFGIGKNRTQVTFQIPLPLELRDQIRAIVPPTGSLISTVRQLLAEALAARAHQVSAKAPTKPED